MSIRIQLEKCTSGDSRYKEIRNRHYVPNHGVVGRSLSYLIHLNGDVVGIITGGSCASAGKARDTFFGLDLVNQFDDYYTQTGEHEGMRRMRGEMLGAIIANTVFRLETHKPGLASATLAAWRHRVVADWYERYGEGVIGFETYILETPQRNGGCYVADNWTRSGRTATGKVVYCKLNDEFFVFGNECHFNQEMVDLFSEIKKRARCAAVAATAASRRARDAKKLPESYLELTNEVTA